MPFQWPEIEPKIVFETRVTRFQNILFKITHDAINTINAGFCKKIAKHKKYNYFSNQPNTFYKSLARKCKTRVNNENSKRCRPYLRINWVMRINQDPLPGIPGPN